MIFFSNMCECGRYGVAIGQDKCFYCCFEEGMKEVSAYIYSDKTNTDNKTEFNFSHLDEFYTNQDEKEISTTHTPKVEPKCHVCKRRSSTLEQNVLNKEFVCKGCMTDEYLLDHYTRRFWFGKKIKDMSKEECLKAIDHVEKIDQYRRVVKRYCIDRVNELYELENQEEETKTKYKLGDGSGSINGEHFVIKNGEVMRKTNLNIFEVMTYLKNAPEDTFADLVINGNKSYTVMYSDGELLTDNAEDIGDYLRLESLINATFDIVEPEEEWIECKDLNEAIEKFNQSGVTIRFGENDDYSYNSSIYTVDDMLVQAISNLGFYTVNSMKIEYKK